jgi:hypothetical protein
MRVSSRRLLRPVAVVVALFAPGVSPATAASPPAPETITSIVQTIIREQPPSQRIDAHDAASTTRPRSNVSAPGSSRSPMAPCHD